MAGRMPRSCCRTTTSCHESAPPVRLPRGQMKMIQTACAWQTTCGTKHTSTTKDKSWCLSCFVERCLGQAKRWFFHLPALGPNGTIIRLVSGLILAWMAGR
jgi:hypothetical protein